MRHLGTLRGAAALGLSGLALAEGVNKEDSSMAKERLVLVGNGMAGVRCLEEILKLAPGRFAVTVIGKEPHPNYNRILLSSVLAGDADFREIYLNDWDWYRQNGIELYTGHTATRVDTETRVVFTDKGLAVPYDKLILATGSLPVILPIPGVDKEGVIAFRTIEDCQTMMAAAKVFRKAVVIGGGLLGLEAARGLLNLGMEVTVVHLMPTLMERQLDPTAARLLQQALEAQGMRFLLEKQTVELLGGDRVTGLRFADGTTEPADLVVMAVGIKPNIDLAKASGIATGRGILVDDFLRTSAPGVYAVGECVEHRGVTYGLVAPLYEQGAVLARHLVGLPTAPYKGSVVYTKLKVSGVDVFSAGQFLDSPDTRAVRVHDELAGVYKKVLIKDGRIVGAVLFGDTSDSRRIVQLMKDGTDVSALPRAELLPGPAPAAAGGVPLVATLADDEIICGCNGVTKGTIVKAILEQGLTTVAEVRACTNASRSCGGCKGLVAQLLEYVLGEKAAAAPAKEPICGCTDLSRDEVVAAIREKHLTHVREVMHVLGWKNPEGCSKCRPAVNYYISMVWPEEHVDDRASRIPNERYLANLQKDGTFSVVPRMYGGVTSPAELKRIAEVAEKYGVPMVKITGGQRIDLLGVKKEDLPRIWEELGMPSGSAYAKAVRTVKSCVGTDFCRFGTQNSIQMAIDIELKFQNLDTPAKVKMAVSGCPRNCAETCTKDFGVVGVEGGWEIWVGGNGGVNPRLTDLLCKVKTAEEVLEMCSAFLQYYRENANWNERTSEFIKRVGIETVRKAVLDPETRRGLVERMERALAARIRDPWEHAVQNQAIRATFADVVPAPVVGD